MHASNKYIIELCFIKSILSQFPIIYFVMCILVTSFVSTLENNPLFTYVLKIRQNIRNSISIDIAHGRNLYTMQILKFLSFQLNFPERNQEEQPAPLPEHLPQVIFGADVVILLLLDHNFFD